MDVFVLDASISISIRLRLRLLLNLTVIRMVNSRQTTKAHNPVKGSSANSLLLIWVMKALFQDVSSPEAFTDKLYKPFGVKLTSPLEMDFRFLRHRLTI